MKGVNQNIQVHSEDSQRDTQQKFDDIEAVRVWRILNRKPQGNLERLIVVATAEMELIGQDGLFRSGLKQFRGTESVKIVNGHARDLNSVEACPENVNVREFPVIAVDTSRGARLMCGEFLEHIA